MDISINNEADTTTSDTSNTTNTASNTTSPITSPNHNKLNLPFHITNDHNIINKTKYYFDNLLTIVWDRNMTFEEYVNEITSFKNKYFNIQNISEIVLNQLNLKQIMDLRIKTKDYMKNVEFFNHNENQILAVLRKMATIHTNQIKTFNNLLNGNENTH